MTRPVDTVNSAEFAEFSELDAAGLNLQAVFNLADLPSDMAASLTAAQRAAVPYRQLILLGHAGTALWTAVQAAASDSTDPIDDFTVDHFKRWAGERMPACDYEFVYPGPAPIGLQSLGQLAGWHHESPFMVGINNRWGTWFAYRAAVLAISHFAPTAPLRTESPCPECARKPCIAACPAGAVGIEAFDLPACMTYRKRPDSSCKFTCLARIACPVGSDYRYDVAQLRHNYAVSLRWMGGT